MQSSSYVRPSTDLKCALNKFYSLYRQHIQLVYVFCTLVTSFGLCWMQGHSLILNKLIGGRFFGVVPELCHRLQVTGHGFDPSHFEEWTRMSLDWLKFNENWQENMMDIFISNVHLKYLCEWYERVNTSLCNFWRQIVRTITFNSFNLVRFVVNNNTAGLFCGF